MGWIRFCWIGLLGLAAAPGLAGQQGVAPAPLVVVPDRERLSAVDDFVLQPLAPAATFEEQVAEQVNVERFNCAVSGCPKPPLKLQANLIQAAEEHSSSMALNDYYSHLDLSVGCIDPGQRILNAGYTGFNDWGENIAVGYTTPTAVMSGWMSSTGHRANILGDCQAVFGTPCPHREMGIGYFLQSSDAATVDRDCNSNCTCTDVTPPECGGVSESCSSGPHFHYWTQVFGARGGTTGYPLIIEREKFQVASAQVDLYVYQPPGTGAQMRFANETGPFSAFQPFAADVLDWNLSSGDGLKAVVAEVTTSSGTFRTCDRIWVSGSGDTSFIFADGFECDGTGSWSALGS